MAEPRQGTLVDSNVLLDVLTEDPTWAEWSAERLAEAVDAGPVLINQVIYGEVAHRFSSIEELEEVLSRSASYAATCRGQQPSWPPPATATTAAGEDDGARSCPTSSSVPTPPS